MKRLTLSIGIAMCCAVFCRSAKSQTTTQITYQDFNNVNTTIQSFLDDKMDMTVAAPPVVSKDIGGDVLTFKYVKHANMGEVNYMYLKFHMAKGTSIITSCDVYGYYAYVVDFFVRYWPTNINFNDGKSGIASCYYLQDKATINLNLQARTGKISILNTGIKNIAQYNATSKANEVIYAAALSKQATAAQHRRDSVYKIHYADSVYRDSLIKIVDSKGIGYGRKTDTSPPIEWLEAILKIKPTGAKSHPSNRP